MAFVLLYVVLEIAAIAAVGAWLGIGWTLALLLAGGLVGLWLTRREGARAGRALLSAVQDRRVAHQELTDGLLIAAGGVLVLLPGFLSDVAGLALLIPPTRSLIRTRLVRAAERRSPALRTARIRGAGPVVDGAVVDGSVVGEPPVPRVAEALPPADGGSAGR